MFKWGIISRTIGKAFVFDGHSVFILLKLLYELTRESLSGLNKYIFLKITGPSAVAVIIFIIHKVILGFLSLMKAFNNVTLSFIFFQVLAVFGLAAFVSAGIYDLPQPHYGHGYAAQPEPFNVSCFQTKILKILNIYFFV